MTVAEGSGADADVLEFAKLQWGRNLTVAEGVAARGQPSGRLPLQWGRNLTVAEGELCRYLIAWCESFNGAAT